jgi:plastocyanin
MKGKVVVAAVCGALVVAIPALAATPSLKGTVGPGFTITMASKPKKAGTYKLVVKDLASDHNFHLFGPGVNVATTVPGKGTKTFVVKLKAGKTYRFICDPHASSMKGSFKVPA